MLLRYLKKIFYNSVAELRINNYRKTQRDQTYVDQTDNLFYLNKNESDEPVTVDNGYDLKEMNSIVNALPQEYRIPFLMYVSGFKYREIADKMDLPLGTIKSRIHSTRQRLQEELKDFR